MARLIILESADPNLGDVRHPIMNTSKTVVHHERDREILLDILTRDANVAGVLAEATGPPRHVARVEHTGVALL